MNELALNYLIRGTGVSALVLFTAAVVLGVAVRGGARPAGARRSSVVRAHRTVSMTAVGLMLVHVVANVVDPLGHKTVASALLPWTSPVFVGLGSLAFDLALVLTVTSLLRDRVGRRTWKAVHLLSYVLWPCVVAHAWLTGQDARTWWMLTLQALCIVAVVFAVMNRRRLARAVDAHLTEGSPSSDLGPVAREREAA